MAQHTDRPILAVDLAGTFLFAIEGAMNAIDGNRDLPGVPVLSLVTALSGGVIRDRLIGVRPPHWNLPKIIGS